MASISRSRSDLPSNWSLPSTSKTWPPRAWRGLLQLLQQLAIDIALAGLLGDQVPQVADLGLADAVDAAEALLDAVGVPRQVVVDHQVRALEVDALAGGVGGQQHLHLGVVLEGLLRLQALFAAHAAVDDDHGLLAAKQRGDALFKIVERVAVLGEDDELLVRRRRWAAESCRRRRGRSGLPRYGWRLPAAPGEDFAEQAGQLAPLGVRAAAANGERERLQALQGLDLGLQLGDGAGGGRLVENLFLGGFDFVVRRVFEILDILGVERRAAGARGLARSGRRAGAAPARAAGFPAARGGGAAIGRWPRATRRAAAAGWSARKPTVPARLSFSSASARLNSSRT